MSVPSFFFVQITDTHLGDATCARRTRQVIASIKRLPFPIDCVVHTGDIMDDPLLDAGAGPAARELFRELNVPVHFLPGNHDILGGDTVALESAYRRHFGEPCSSAEYHGVVFLFMNMESLGRGTPGGRQEEWDALEARLASAGGAPVILFQHTPPGRTIYNHRFLADFTDDAAQRLQAMLARFDVKAVIAGHYNRDQHHWLGDIPLYVSSSVVWHNGRQASYRVYEYEAGRIGYWTIYIEPGQSLTTRVRRRIRKYVNRLRGARQ